MISIGQGLLSVRVSTSENTLNGPETAADLT